jgi:hypothetical protein
MKKRARSPRVMVATPRSQPLITSPFPTPQYNLTNRPKGHHADHAIERPSADKAGFWVRITLMRIWIHLFTSILIRILLLIKVRRIANLRPLAYRPSRPPFEPPRLHFERPRLHLEPRKLLDFDFNAEPDPAFHSNADPDPAFKNTADPYGSRSETPRHSMV